jgi:hypothetical protein
MGSSALDAQNLGRQDLEVIDRLRYEVENPDQESGPAPGLAVNLVD